MPIFNGELKGAQLELLSADPSSPQTGRFWHNTTSKLTKFKDADAVRVIVDRDYLALVSFTNPMTTEGDIIYGASMGAVMRLGKGSSDQVLITGDAPSYAKIRNVNVDDAAAIATSKLAAAADIANISGLTSNAQTQLNAKINSSLIGQANGIAPLDAGSKIAAAYLPSYVDDVLEFANFAALPNPGETGKIYITTNDNKQFRWTGSVYVEMVASPGSTDAVPEGMTNLYFTDARAIAATQAMLGGFTNTSGTATRNRRLGVDSTGGVRTITLQAGQTNDRYLIYDSKGGAGTSSILVQTNGTDSFEGLNPTDQIAINFARGWLYIEWNGSKFSFISSSGGSSGSSNSTSFSYVPNGDFEATSNGVKPADWTAYLDTAQATPVDGVGGSPNAAVTFLVSTTSPLRGTKSAILTKDANNRQGTGYSCPITIASPDRNKTLKLYYEADASGNYVQGDVAFYLYDITNGILITPDVASIPKLSGASFEIKFDLTNSLSYRLIMHIASTSALAYTLKVDTLIMNGDKVYSGNKGPGPWTAYPGDVSGMTDNQGTIKSFYRTNGESIEVRFDFLKNATPGSGSSNGTFSLPAGFTPVSNIVGPGVGNPIVGTAGTFSVETSNAFNESQVVMIGSRLAIINTGGSNYYVGSDYRAAAQVNIIASIPVNELLGSADSAAAGTDYDAAFNTNTATSGNTNATDFGYGDVGTPVLAMSIASGAVARYRVRFRSRVQRTDKFKVFFQDSSINSDQWVEAGNLCNGAMIDNLHFNGTEFIGAGIESNYSGYPDTDVNMVFGRYQTGSNVAWVTTNKRWLVIKYNPTKPSGVYAASSTQRGFLSHESEGTFTGSFSGVTGTITGTFTYVRTGKQVTLQLGTNVVFTKDGSAGIVTISGLPSAITPSAESYGTPAGIAYNGAAAAGNTRITTSGTIQMYRSSAEDVWAASSSGVMVRGAITYRLP